MYSVWFCHVYVFVEILNGFYQKLWLVTASVVLTNISTVLEFPAEVSTRTPLLYLPFSAVFHVARCSPSPAPQSSSLLLSLGARAWGCVHLEVQRSCWHTSVAESPRPLKSKGSPGQAGCVQLTCPLEPGPVLVLFTGSPGTKEQLQAVLSCAAGSREPPTVLRAALANT